MEVAVDLIDINDPKKKRKRGVKNKSNYKSEIIKKARVSGTQFNNYAGKDIPVRKVGDDCKCRRKCFEVIGEDDRLAVFNRFLGLGTKNEQDCYLQSLMSTIEVKQRRRRKPANESTKPERGATFEYEISTTSGKKQVCKLAFMNIHSVTSERVRRLGNLLREGKLPHDKRGLNISGNAKPETVINMVKEHISSYPTKITHYGNTEKHFLNEKLCVYDMHKAFQQKYPEVNVNYKFYLKIFNQQFSLTFGLPQVDTCCTCEELQAKIKSKFLCDNVKKAAAAEKMVHIRRAKKFVNEMKEITKKCKEDEKVGGVCIDYMQNLQLPCIPVQETFYLRQLTISVFCIHNLRDSNVTYFLYHEGVGSKGPDEVCSFLLKYFESSFTDVENLHIFSDGCGGQNKNHTLVRLCSALVSIKKFNSIDQYFPVRGHSFLPCDRDFSVLKRKIRKTDRIYTLREYRDLILSSAKKNIFSVVMVKNNEIIDFKNWWPRFYKRKMLSDETTGRLVPRNEKLSFKISSFMHMSHNSETEGKVSCKTYIDGLQSQTFSLRNSNPAVLSLPSCKSYPDSVIPINSKKIDDIQKLIPYLPDDDEVKKFYEEILAWPTVNKDNPEVEPI